MAGVVALVSLALLPWVAPSANGQQAGAGHGRHLIIVTGLGGEAYYQELFQRWAASLYQVARERLGLRPEQITRLARARDGYPLRRM